VLFADGAGGGGAAVDEVLDGEQVARGIAADDEFGEDDQVGALRAGGVDGADDALRVAGQVADGGVGGVGGGGGVLGGGGWGGGGGGGPRI
jgi:hypothetical protein